MKYSTFAIHGRLTTMKIGGYWYAYLNFEGEAKSRHKAMLEAVRQMRDWIRRNERHPPKGGAR